MILQSLNSYYDRLSTTKGILPPYGWSWEKISYCVVLNGDGSIHHIDDLRISQEVKNKTTYTPRSLMVPKLPEGRASGVKANYFWDNSAYSLGLSEKTKDLNKKYEDFWAKVRSFDPGSNTLKAMRNFQPFWDENKQNYDHLKTKEVLDLNFVFRLIDDGNNFVHECEAFKTQWTEELSNYRSGLSDGQCLIEGESTKIADLHSLIKGVDKAQSSGALIVSFNKESFESYGFKKGKNASVGTNAAFKYVTALNYLLRKDNNKQRLKIGDAVTIFWAKATDDIGAVAAENFMSEALSPTDEKETAALANILQQVATGVPLQALRPDLDPLTKFYVLGLSPNAARISIRFWNMSTLDEMTQRIAQHYHDLHLEPQQGNGLPAIWKLTYSTAPIRDGKAKADNISPQLAGNLARAIFTGQAYPQSLLAQLLQRMRSDGVVDYTRASLCKAIINRQIRLNQSSNIKVISMSLDVEEKNVAYRMGRLFAVLEAVQKQALGQEINATIRDRYWGSASATPALVFPMLMRNSMNHLSKIRKDIQKKHLAFFFEIQMGDIQENMPTSWPRNLNLQDQGRFTIGYYHQRFTRKIKDSAGIEIENLVAVINEEESTTATVDD